MISGNIKRKMGDVNEWEAEEERKQMRRKMTIRRRRKEITINETLFRIIFFIIHNVTNIFVFGVK